jgi:hypothetical protein
MKVAEVFDDLEELDHHPLLKNIFWKLVLADCPDQRSAAAAKKIIYIYIYIYYCTEMPCMIFYCIFNTKKFMFLIYLCSTDLVHQ